MGTGCRMQNEFLPEPISKVLVGQKRGFLEVGETTENSQKRVKMRDLESVFRSEAQARRGGSYTADPDKVSNSKALDVNLDLNATYKNYEDLKSRDDSECESSVIPSDRKDSMRVWEGLKQNNFMSTLHENVQTQMPKPKRRKKNSINDVMTKKTTEFAKKEQVDRFATLAAPSGLLNGLNPGIINHVRNSKQVHAIIVALLKSERSENGHSKTFSQCNEKNENDRHVINPSSSVSPLFEDASCMSNEGSANFSSVSSLPVKAANVASQWLELLNHDIRGRLEALSRSKKRVLSVITTDLPLLISREFSSNPEKENVDAHVVRWTSLLEQMDKSLSEEENHLESWLNQVKELQLHSERGLNRAHSIGHDIRSGEVNNLGNDLSIMAAAGSIYSTCNFLSSIEN